MSLLTFLLESSMEQQVLANLGQEVHITYLKDEKLAGGKKNPHQGRITKLVRNLPVQLVAPGDYQKARQGAGQEDFQAQARKWGTRRPDGLIEHNGELYIEYIAKGPGQKSQYFCDGQPIDKSEIQGLAPSVTKSDESSGVTLRALKLSTIKNIS